MHELDQDYRTVLLAKHEPPCLSLYQPTHRAFPDKQQDSIRFRNLVKELELSLARKYRDREMESLLRPFHELAENTEFWNYSLDGIAVFASPDLFKVYRLQRPVMELAIAADSFHTKPLMRILQSADRYHVLGLNRERVVLYEGNRYALDEVKLPPGFPRTAEKVAGDEAGDPERRNRAYGAEGPGQTAPHGTDDGEDFKHRDTERFFRAVDDAVLEQYSRPFNMPLLLAALPEHHHLFRSVSANPFLMPEAIDVHPDAVTLDQLRERAWKLVLPLYLDRLKGFIDQFEASRSENRSGADLAEIARAAAAGRISTLLIEADRLTPGSFDPSTGSIEFGRLDDPSVDDLLDDLGEHALRTGGEVVIVPAERMPTDTGAAAIYRF